MLDTDTIAAFLDDDLIQLQEAALEYARETLLVLEHPSDDGAARRQARDILESAGEAGWFGYHIPEVYGGVVGHPSMRACGLIREAFSWAAPLADAVLSLQILGSMPLVLSDNEALKRKWLPRVSEGEAMAAFAMTEPEAGSDVAAIATTAARTRDGYLLQGHKSFISNAGLADYYVVFAKTDLEAGHRGLTAFLVEADRPGLRFLGAQQLSEPHPLGEMAFEGCRIPAENRLSAEGDGFKLGMRTLDHLRATVGAAATGMAARALGEALDHARKRRQFGKPLGEFQLVKAKLAEMATRLAASRLLVMRALWEKDRGRERVTLESAMAKSFATEAGQWIIDQAVQILGGRGVLAGHPVERLYRAIRPLRIYEGTTEIQQLVIASQIL